MELGRQKLGNYAIGNWSVGNNGRLRVKQGWIPAYGARE